MKTPYPRPNGPSTTSNNNTVPNEQRDGVSETQSNGESEDQSFKGNRASKDSHDSEEKLRRFVRIRSVQEAAQVALSDKGQGDPVFKFARTLKAFEMTRDARLTAKELPGAFAVWWPMAKPTLKPGTDREGWLFLFLNAYEKVRTPFGANVIEEAIARLAESPLPPEVNNYESPGTRRLVHLCYELQLICGDDPFFLSVRDAARVIGCDSPGTAGAYLKGLVRDGILIAVKWGIPGEPFASRFKYRRSPIPAA